MADEAGGIKDDASHPVRKSERATVALVVSRFYGDWSERKATARLVIGALAACAEVSVISLEGPAAVPSRQKVRLEGIFPVYRAAASMREKSYERLLRASLERQPEAVPALPEVVSRGLLEERAEHSAEALALIERLRPDVVLLAGPETLWLAYALAPGRHRPRLIALPLIGTDPLLSAPALAPLAEVTDGIGTFSEGEQSLLVANLGARRKELCRQLRLAFEVNKAAASEAMSGMFNFGRYLLVVSGWPHDEDARPAPPHQYLHDLLGDISIAEVRPSRWLVTAPGGDHFEVPWPASRMNLWRLMARAVATLDVRNGPVGREAIESMLFGTPVVVPAGSVAADHAMASKGGLWYSSPAEMVDAVGYFVEQEAARQRFGTSGQEWAEREHGDTDRFVAEIRRFVLA